MEQGTSAGTWVAYALLALFWLVVGLVLLRTVVLTSLLLISPLDRVWKWLRGTSTDESDRPV